MSTAGIQNKEASLRLWLEIGSISASRTQASPSVEPVAVHFAKKMSNGKDNPDDSFVPIDTLTVPLKSLFRATHFY